MLFNSYEFIFMFLPVAFVLYFITSTYFSRLTTNVTIIILSLYFYAYPNPADLVLIVASILLNFTLTHLFIKFSSYRKTLLTVGIVVNLTVLFSYKYINFIIEIINEIAPFARLPEVKTHLPLAISFFTFQQISFIVDQYRAGKLGLTSFDKYATAVLFFPHLIAGPLVEYKKLIPQLKNKIVASRFWAKAYLGLFVFILGLSKKLIIADSLNPLVDLVFKSGADISNLSFIATTAGVISYTFQLYFDFSGYSDMAIGLGLMFGVLLPVNFNSPYKATSIVDFWRRWHISLSTFLRDYLFIPLGGSRAGELLRFRNLFLTMLIGGVWHGAGWNFVIWGAWHGGLLCAVHFIRKLSPKFVDSVFRFDFINKILTFLAVVFGWIFFRATNFDAASSILGKIIQFDLVAIHGQVQQLWSIFRFEILLGCAAAVFVFFMPNTNQLTRVFKYWVFKRKHIVAQVLVTLVLAVLLNICLLLMSTPMTFLYYQF